MTTRRAATKQPALTTWGQAYLSTSARGTTRGDIVLHLDYQDLATGGTVHRRTVRTMISGNEWVEIAYETRNGAEQKVMEIRARRINGSAPTRP